jgi:hypothetical protein
MLGLGLSQSAFFQSPIVTAQKGIHRLMHDLERAVMVSAHVAAYRSIASGRIESYLKLATHLVGTSERPWRLPAPIPCDEKVRSFKAQIPFLILPSRKLNAKKRHQ